VTVIVVATVSVVADYWDRRLSRREVGVAASGWAGLIAYVILWDRFAPVTLTRGMGEGLEHRLCRPLVVFVWAWVLSHLFFRKPEKVLWFV
jgi:membrane associated rhomboid family serine protease